MKIHDIKVTNWQSPGKDWWDKVQERPDEPLIEATFELGLTWNEYQKLIKDDNK